MYIDGNSTISLLWVLIGLLVVFVIIIALFLVRDIKAGWNGEKTLTYAFSVVIFFCGISTSIFLSDYFISNSKSIIKSNNELYKAFERAEKYKKLKAYKTMMDNHAKEKQLNKINIFLTKNNSSFVPLTHENIDTFC